MEACRRWARTVSKITRIAHEEFLLTCEKYLKVQAHQVTKVMFETFLFSISVLVILLLTTGLFICMFVFTDSKSSLVRLTIFGDVSFIGSQMCHMFLK